MTGIYLWNVSEVNVSTTIWGTITVEWNSLTVLNEKRLDSKWLLWSLSQCLLLGFKGLHLHIFSLEYLFFFSSWQQYKYVCKRLEVLFKVTAEITACQKMVLLGYLYLRKLCVIIKISENFSCKLKIVASPLFSKMQVISHSVKTQLWPWTASLSAYWSNFWNLLSITWDQVLFLTNEIKLTGAAVFC